MKKYLIAILILLTSTILNADIGLITVPKSGTHLILEVVNQIGEATGQKKPLTGNQQNCWCSFWHTCAIPHYTLNRKHILLGIRDPRDVIISTVHWYDFLIKHGCENFNQHFKSKWLKLSFRQKVKFLVSTKRNFVMQELQNMMQLSIRNPDFLTIKYEDLVGEKGGGDNERQYQTIANLLCYINIDPHALDIELIQSNIYGKSQTFRNGKIGTWKEYPYPQDFDDAVINDFLNFFDYSF